MPFGESKIPLAPEDIPCGCRYSILCKERNLPKEKRETPVLQRGGNARRAILPLVSGMDLDLSTARSRMQPGIDLFVVGWRHIYAWR
jgi:hypothetical protein